MRGRPPKPTAIKKLAGNPGKRKLPTEPEFENETIPSFKDDITLPPDNLLTDSCQVALQEWNRQAPLLAKAGILKRVDRPAFMAYCFAFQEYVKATQEIAKYGAFVKNSKGELIVNPFIKVQRTSFEQFIKLSTEFGLTPSSRVRLGSFDDDKDKDKGKPKTIEDELWD